MKRNYEDERTSLIAHTEAVLHHVRLTMNEFTDEQIEMMLHNANTYIEEHYQNLTAQQRAISEYSAMSDEKFFRKMKKKINN